VYAMPVWLLIIYVFYRVRLRMGKALVNRH